MKILFVWGVLFTSLWISIWFGILYAQRQSNERYRFLIDYGQSLPLPYWILAFYLFTLLFNYLNPNVLGIIGIIYLLLTCASWNIMYYIMFVFWNNFTPFIYKRFFHFDMRSEGLKLQLYISAANSFYFLPEVVQRVDQIVGTNFSFLTQLSIPEIFIVILLLIVSIEYLVYLIKRRNLKIYPDLKVQKISIKTWNVLKMLWEAASWIILLVGLSLFYKTVLYSVISALVLSTVGLLILINIGHISNNLLRWGLIVAALFPYSYIYDHLPHNNEVLFMIIAYILGSLGYTIITYMNAKGIYREYSRFYSRQMIEEILKPYWFLAFLLALGNSWNASIIVEQGFGLEGFYGNHLWLWITGKDWHDILWLIFGAIFLNVFLIKFNDFVYAKLFLRDE